MQYHALQANELQPESIQSATVGDHEVLLANVDGDIFALYPKCIHYGAYLREAGCGLDGAFVVRFYSGEPARSVCE
jgi:nitrite reductase/ring-hydroxylating ferredoxin subunit